MSLVAYYGSGSSDDDDKDEMDTEEQRREAVPEVSKPVARGVASVLSESLKGHGTYDLTSTLPKPKGALEGAAGSEIGDIPPKKTYGDEETPEATRQAPIFSGSSGFAGFSAKKSAAGIMQISIPTLRMRNFEDDDDETKNKKKQLNSSQKGSGLFAILPEPKSEVTYRPPGSSSNSASVEKEAVAKPNPEFDIEMTSSLAPNMMNLNLAKPKSVPLIPHVVHQTIIGKRPAPDSDRLAQVRAKYMKQESNFKIVSRSSAGNPAAASTKGKPRDDGDDSDEEDGGNVDFFSLDPKSNETFERLMNAESESGPGTDSVIGKNYVDDYSMEEEEPLPAPQFANSEPAAVAPEPTQPDLMQYIQPKRGKSKGEPVNIIDVNADDLRPTSTEWLKTMTDKSAMPPRKNNLPGGMMKRKHQITYLAAEAKAREEELQNQWAQNRTARRATQNKYGF